MLKLSATLITLLSCLGVWAGDNDSITVTGQLNDKCVIEKFQVTRFNYSEDPYVGAVNATGGFSIKIPFANAGQYTIAVGRLRYDFLATPEQKVYNFTVTCKGNGDFQMKLDESKENAVFDALGGLEKKIIEDCTNIISKSKGSDSGRVALENLFRAQDQSLIRLSLSAPETFAGKILVPAAFLPPALPKEHFIDTIIYKVVRSETWNDKTIYDTDIPLSFLSLVGVLSNKKTDEERAATIGSLLASSPSNPQAAKLFQRLVFEFLFFRLNEKLLHAYCDWAAENPDKIISNGLKNSLKGMQKVLAGNEFINVSLYDSSQVKRSLADVVNKNAYTLLLFWSADCDHCKQEMPALVQFYKKYHSAGLEVFAVAVDCPLNKWKKYIAENTPAWVNVTGTKDETSGFETQYGVNYLPAMILIDQQGTIVSRFGDLKRIEKLMLKK